MAVTCNFVLPKENRNKSFLLAIRKIKESHSAENHKRKLDKILAEYSVTDKQKENLFISTDAGANIRKVIEGYNSLNVYCINHFIHYTLIKSIETFEEISILANKCKKILN